MKKRVLLLSIVAISCFVMTASPAMAAAIPALYWNFGENGANDLSGEPYISGSVYSNIDVNHVVTPGLSSVASAIPSNGYAAYEDASAYGGVYVANYSGTPLDETSTVSIFLRMNPGVVDTSGEEVVIDDIFAVRNRDADGSVRNTNIRYGFESHDGVLNFQLLGAGASTPTVISLSNPLTAGTWYDVIGTFNQGVANFYVQESVSGMVVENITQAMSFTSLATLNTDPNVGDGVEAAEVTLLHCPWYQYGQSEGYQIDQVAVWNSLATPAGILTNGITLPEPPAGPELPSVMPTAYWTFGADAGNDIANADGNTTDLYWIAGLDPNTEMAVNAKRSNGRGLYEVPGGPSGWAYNGSLNDKELDITGAVSIFARVKADAFDGIDDIARANNGGSGDERKDQYALEFVNGVPQFVATASMSSYNASPGTTVKVGLSESLDTGVWYDITGVFEPSGMGGIMTITVYESETGELVETVSQNVYFSELWSNEDGGSMQLHVFEVPGGVNGVQPGLSLEQLAVWNIALTGAQIRDLTVVPEPGTMVMLFGIFGMLLIWKRRG